MKLNKITLALAAMALVGCSSEDVSDFSANQTIDENGLVQLSPNFVLAGVGQDDATTRTHWNVVGGAVRNVFLPIYNGTAAAGDILSDAADLPRQSVGLCWLGQVPGTDVYTNYQFYHFGWLNNGATKAEFECDELTNGSLYSEIGDMLEPGVTNGLVAATPGTEATPADFVGAIPAKSSTVGLNYNSGIYKTDNKAIFGGDYIVYYPFNAEFKNAGTIPAAAVTTFPDVATVVGDPQLGEQTFRYSGKVNIEGGAQASDFGLKNLSTLVQLKLITKNAAIGSKKIDQIVLYSAKEQLLKEAHLAADKIVAGEEGTKLYVTEESKGTKTITVNATTGGGITTDATVNNWKNAFITVLPVDKVEDLVVLVHQKVLGGGLWARYNMPNYQFKAGAAQVLELPLTSTDFKADYIAVDEASLINARNEARAAGGAKTITVIGDITLDGTTADALNTYNFNTAADRNITIKGNDIIIPEDITFNTTAKIESNVRVLGKSCCSGTNGAILNVDGGTLNNVTIEPTEANATTKALYDQYNPEVNFNGNATIAAGKKFDVQAGNVNVFAAVQHKGDINIAEDVTLIVKTGGDLNFMGATVVNNGTIEVKQNGMFDMTDANGNATATDGQRMTNNGKFIHNVDAGVGTAVQSMNQNGEYRCRVNDQIKLSDAYLQWLACSVIEIVDGSATGLYNLGVGDGVGYKHNTKFIDIEVNTPIDGVMTFNNPVVSGTNGDSKTIQTGKLTVIAGGLDVDFVTGNGKRTLKVNGDMTVKANSQFVDSKAITITENLKVEGAGITLTYAGAKKNEGGLEVRNDIIVDGLAADFDASALNALDITCVNFTLKNGAQAEFGNRTEGDAHNLDASGTISNPAGCKFDIKAAAGGNVLAWVTCSKLIVGGTFTNARPRVQ
jgi:hypothetical protein